MKTSLLLTPILVTVTVLTAPTTLDSGVSLEQLASDPALLKSTFSSNVVTAAAAAAGYDTTSNQLTDGTPCRATTVIYARGTTQDGNIGAAGDVGPDLFNNLSSIIGASKLAVQGVDYPATIAGYLAQLAGDNGTGGQTMADLVTRVSFLLRMGINKFRAPSTGGYRLPREKKFIWARLMARTQGEFPVPIDKSRAVRLQPGWSGCARCRGHLEVKHDRREFGCCW